MSIEPMRICIDLDGVICELRRPGQDYADLSPVPGAADKIRTLRAAGHQIIISTARHMKTTGGNVGAVVARKGLVTLDWLKRHGIEFDELHFGKPYAQLYIDDNALCFSSWDDIDADGLPRSHEELVLWDEGTAAQARGPNWTCVIVAMAGSGSRFRGSRFVDASGNPPKPLIDVAGKPMVWWALQSLIGVAISQLVFIVLDEHEQSCQLSERLPEIAEACFLGAAHAPSSVEVVVPSGRLPGQLSSVLQARERIGVDSPVLIAGADTFVDSDLGRRINTRDSTCRGLISVANLPGDRWSFARANESGAVVEVTEKRRISDHASTGLYWFASGREFLNAADASIKSERSLGGEYYVMPTYAELINLGAKVELAPVKEVWDMGTPGALEAFLTHVRNSFLAHAERKISPLIAS